MSNKSPLLNIIFQSLDKVTRKVVRDFGEIENLQVSPDSINRFVLKTEREVTNNLLYEFTKARPNWKFKNNINLEISENQYYWIIDPLNGKTNFSHALPYFSISVAVEYNSEIITTVILDPLRDEIYFAEKGKGAFQNNRRIRVSKRNTINSCVFSFYDESNKKNISCKSNYVKMIKDLALLNSSLIREFGSSALNFAWLASGKIDCLFIHNLDKNQVACGELLIKEAGGYISDLKYVSAYKSSNDFLVGANPVIHKELLKKINNLTI